MSLSSVLFLFLAHLGVGIAFTLVLVSREAGIKFFRFNAGLAAILLIVAIAFRPADAPAAFGGPGAPGSNDVGWYALIAATAAIVLYWATIGRAFTSIRSFILWFAVIAGTLAVIAQAIAVSSDRAAGVQLLTIASFLSSAALLGGACTAMILGHWYLILPSMQVSHLQSIVKVHIISMVIRVLVVASAVMLAILTWQPGMGPSFRHYMLSAGGIFFWQRVLFGLFGPALLSYLTWETAKIRSTQSATGILYVDFFTVVVGEVLAKYLLLATRVPV
jgi:protein NrfD